MHAHMRVDPLPCPLHLLHVLTEGHARDDPTQLRDCHPRPQGRLCVGLQPFQPNSAQECNFVIRGLEFGSVSAALDWAARLGTPSHLMQEAPREGVQAAIPVMGHVLIRMQVVQCKLPDQLRRATPQRNRSAIPAWAHVTFPEVGKRCRTPRHVHGAGQVLTSEAGI